MNRWTPGATTAANYLCSMPSGHTTLNKSDLQSLMMESGGQLLAQGHLYEIKSKRLAPDVYRVSLRQWKDSAR